MLGPWALVPLGLAWAASCAWFYGAGQDSELATAARVDAARAETAAIAADAAASAIANIKVEHKVVQGRIERVTVEKAVYRECRHDADSVRDINQALTGRGPESAAGGKLPGADAAR